MQFYDAWSGSEWHLTHLAGSSLTPVAKEVGPQCQPVQPLIPVTKRFRELTHVKQILANYLKELSNIPYDIPKNKIIFFLWRKFKPAQFGDTSV
jgi:hypothetical protein